MKKFWVVVRDRNQCNFSRRHYDLDEATAEAERLCKKENERFFVLENIGCFQPTTPPVEWVEEFDEIVDDEDEFPF